MFNYLETNQKSPISFKKTSLLFLTILLTSQLFAQKDIKSILNSKQNFDQIVTDADDYFKTKYPDLTKAQLSEGIHRDGKFVKYQRWKAYWKNHLNPDRTLGSAVSFHKQLSKSSDNTFQIDVDWTNISNTEYITGQIGLGRTTSMGFHPTDAATFYVGAAKGGIWKTTDGGQSYTSMGDDLPYLAVSAIVVDQDNPSTIYAAISDHVWYGGPALGIYKSTDAGNTWVETVLQFSLSAGHKIYWMEANSVDQDHIYVATTDGLYETTDGFQTVNQVNTLSVSDVHFKSDDSQIIYFGTSNGAFHRSTDGGANFTMIQDFGNSFVRIAVNDINTDEVVVSHNSNMYRSTNNGNSFGSALTFPEGNYVIEFTNGPTPVLLAGNFECYLSTNNGASWTQLTQWLGNNGLPLIHVDQRNVFVNPLLPNDVYFCNDGGIFKYGVNNNSWDDLSNGLAITQYYDIANAQTDVNVISGGSQDNGSMFRNANGDWEEFASTGDGMVTQIDPTDANIRYWEYQNGSVRRNENGVNTGISPPGQNGEGAWETPFKLDPNNPNRIVIGYDVVYESFNRGDDWNTISGQLAGGDDLHEIAIAKTNSERIYATRGTTLYVKNVNNDNWTMKTTPATISISDIEVDPLEMNTIYIVNSGYGNNQKVYQSTDAGDTWTNISLNLPNVAVTSLEMYEGVDGAFFVGTENGVYFKDALLDSYVEYGSLPHTSVDDIEIMYSANLIRIGTHGRGIFEAPINIELCPPGATNNDDDELCDVIDCCPFLDNALFGTTCDDGDPFTDGEVFTDACTCADGVSNVDHCAAEGSGGTGGDWIKRVSLNTMDHTSAKTAYSDFRNINTSLLMDQTYTITVELNFSFDLDHQHVWIDTNRDGTFSSDEEITMSDYNNNHESTGLITIPSSGVTEGATTMRVRNIYATDLTGYPCGSYFGEVEDYTIYIVDPCPADLLFTDTNFYGAALNTITSGQTIEIVNSTIWESANLEIKAGDYIELSPDVEVLLGAELLISTEGCGGN